MSGRKMGLALIALTTVAAAGPSELAPPPSRVSHTPPQDMPIRTTALSRGSTQIEWIAGHSVPPPIHCWRFGSSHSERISSQVVP